MATAEFIVLGPIRGKDRPRVNFIRQTIRTSHQTLGYEAWVKDCYVFHSGGKMLHGEIKATITAYFDIPASTSKVKRIAMLTGKINPTIAPDADNIAKVILDALNKIAYKDDKQVTSLTVLKRYAAEAHVSVTLEGNDEE